MKWLIAIVLLAATASYSVSGREIHLTEDEFEEEFHVMFNDPEEKAEAAKRLSKAEEEINKVNKEYEEGKGTYTEKLYQDSILSEEEFEKEKGGVIMAAEIPQKRGLGIIPSPAHIIHDPENIAKMNAIHRELAMKRSTLPESFNAVEKGLITPVKNQGACGSCAAFAATALHETCMIKAGAPFNGLDLSEQFLVDCAYETAIKMNPKQPIVNGCNGAQPYGYSLWFQWAGGIAAHEGHYPYLNEEPLLNCKKAWGLQWNSGAKVVQAFDAYYTDDGNVNDEEKIKRLLVEHGAVMTVLHVDTSFYNYAQGVYDGCKVDQTKEQWLAANQTNGLTGVDHGVLLVGYGNENGVDYWLVKNSWGKGWGEQGYVKVKRGVNMCGIELVSVNTECVKNGVPDPAPPVPTQEAMEPKFWCDVSNIFPAHVPFQTKYENIKATYMGTNGQIIESLINCEGYMCGPSKPGPTNACRYICGQDTC